LKPQLATETEAIEAEAIQSAIEAEAIL